MNTPPRRSALSEIQAGRDATVRILLAMEEAGEIDRLRVDEDVILIQKFPGGLWKRMSWQEAEIKASAFVRRMRQIRRRAEYLADVHRTEPESARF
jgi:hypothetical protein